jgi:nucleoside-diphosphate-sugar epimerase
MNLSAYLRSRLRRGFDLTSLGPNEARVFFDVAISVAALIAAVLFRWIFIAPLPFRSSLLTALLPALLVTVAAAVGVYTRLKLARSLVKAGYVIIAIAVSCAVAWLIGCDSAVTALWALMTMPALVLARVLLGLPFSRHPSVTTLAVTRHGPVLIIGGAGYIGSLTTELLLQRGYRVRVLDRLMYGRNSLQDFTSLDTFEFIEGDATDISKLAAATRNASAVVHLAGLVGDPACAVDSEFTRHANIVATRMAKEVAQGLGVHRFIFASSCSVYGATDRKVREGDALNPVSLYAQTKIDSERELLYAVRDYFFVTILRFATVFGHSHRPRFDLVANLFTAQAMKEGQITVTGPDQWRPFIHARDLARAIVTVLEAEPELVQSQIFNVGDDRLNMTIGQLGEVVRRVVSPLRGVHITTRDDVQDKRNYSVSFDKIRTQLGFQAEMTVEDGVREIVEHFRRGTYRDFRDPLYHNLEMTRAAVGEFYDPSEVTHLYAPLASGLTTGKG